MGTDDYRRCYAAVLQAANDHTELTTDDVWPYLDHPPTERNCIGKAFSEAARQGWIEGTERFVRSTRPEAKGRRVQVWRATPPTGLFAP